MVSFPELLKEIRKNSGLTQEELANALSVSTVLVSMIESGQKEISKKFILNLADKLEVHPNSITPFLYGNIDISKISLTKIEEEMIKLGEKLQISLISKKAKNLKKYARK
ncbi:MAG: helix-turn-helix transcriptional regulator [Patescibacteria group bacterium]